MASYSRWDDTEYKRRSPAGETRTAVEHDLALGQLIYDLRTETGLSQRELAERMSTTQSVISRLEEGGGARNRSMSPAEWWGSRDAIPGGRQVPGWSSAVTAGSVSRAA